jgi:hypothetical protein
MTERKIQIPTAQVSRDISDYTIGLAKLAVYDRVEDATCAGSATLVTVGKLYGLLTAAHVLTEALPKKGAVGIILFSDRFLQKQVIQMEDAELLPIRGDTYGPNGPDLGFIRLPEQNIGWLKAKNSFYNLTKRRDPVLANQVPAPNHIDAVIGLIDELTKEIPVPEPKRRANAFSGLFGNADVIKERDENGFDLLDIEMMAYSDFTLPNSFEGMSGGALWRIYFVEKDNSATIVERRLIGVPFHQSADKDSPSIITCHGPKGIYRSLIDEIIKKWPDAGAQA